MDEVTTLTTLDYVGILSSAVAAIVAFKSLSSAFEWLINKLGIKFKWIEDKKADRELLKKTAEHVTKLEERLTVDEQFYNNADEHFGQEMVELKKSVEDLTVMSKDILDKINIIDSSNESLKKAVIEVLYDAIDKQCDRYINELKGIPSSEVSWFTDRFNLYDSNGGNHGLKHKVKYCLDKLPILPG